MRCHVICGPAAVFWLPAAFILLVTGCLGVRAEEGPSGRASEGESMIYGALVLASNRSEAQAGTGTLKPELLEQLGKAFEFRRFELIGEHTQPLLAEYESWVIPSPELFMRVDSKGPVEGGLGLHLQLWRRENVVLKSDTILRPGSPLFIEGPEVGEDRLLFILKLTP